MSISNIYLIFVNQILNKPLKSEIYFKLEINRIRNKRFKLKIKFIKT